MLSWWMKIREKIPENGYDRHHYTDKLRWSWSPISSFVFSLWCSYPVCLSTGPHYIICMCVFRIDYICLDNVCRIFAVFLSSSSLISNDETHLKKNMLYSAVHNTLKHCKQLVLYVLNSTTSTTMNFLSRLLTPHLSKLQWKPNNSFPCFLCQ